VAKRRNLKKEKASRNLAYARQFRKKTSHFSSRKKRFYGSNRSQEESQGNETKDNRDIGKE
jgi:hypothetical protein